MVFGSPAARGPVFGFFLSTLRVVGLPSYICWEILRLPLVAGDILATWNMRSYLPFIFSWRQATAVASVV